MERKIFLNDVKLLSFVDCKKDGSIKVAPLYGEVKNGISVTVSGETVSYRGRVHVDAKGDMAIKPYNDKPRGKKPVVLYKSELCTIRMHQDGHVSERWHFKPTSDVVLLSEIRRREQRVVNEFYRTLMMNCTFPIGLC